MPGREFLTVERYFALAETIAKTIFGSKVRNWGVQTRKYMPRLALWSRDLDSRIKRCSSDRRVFRYPTSFACVNFPQKKAAQGLTRTLSWRCDRNVALDESYPTVVTLWKLFSQSYDSSGESLVHGPFSLPAGRRRSVLGPFPPVETF